MTKQWMTKQWATKQWATRVARWLSERMSGPSRDTGMSTAEYAVGTLAAVAFAGVLLKVLTSPSVQSALTSIVMRALK